MVVACTTSDRPIADSLSDPRYRDLLLTIANEVLADESSQNDRISDDDFAALLDRIVTLIRTAGGVIDSGKTANEHSSDDRLTTTLRGPIAEHARI